MEISREILIAAIAAVPGVVMAVISLISNRWTAAQQRETQIELEKTRTEMIKRNERRQRQISLIKDKMDFSMKDSEVIQEARDTLSKLTASPFKNICVKEMAQMFSAVSLAMEEQYKKQGAIRDKKYLREIHTAKDIIRSADNKLAGLGEDIEYVHQIDAVLLTDLQASRDQLKSIQSRIRIEYDKLIAQYIGEQHG